MNELEQKTALMKKPWTDLANNPENQEILVKAMGLKKISGPVEQEQVIALGNKAAAVILAIEKARVAATGPLLQAKKELDADAENHKAPYESAKRHLGSINAEFVREQDRLKRAQEEELRRQKAELERQEREAREKAEKEARAQAAKAPAPAAPVQEEGMLFPTAGPKAPTVPEARPESEEEARIREEKRQLEYKQQVLQQQGRNGAKAKWVFKIKEPMKVPGEYLSPDLKKIQAAVDSGLRFIPGVEVYEDIQTTFRATGKG